MFYLKCYACSLVESRVCDYPISGFFCQGYLAVSFGLFQKLFFIVR